MFAKLKKLSCHVSAERVGDKTYLRGFERVLVGDGNVYYESTV